MTIAKEYQYERLIRLIGSKSYEKLRHSHLLVMGVGGVGSWATEALARMDIGRFTLVDFDTVRPSNINRQIIATPRQLGRLKCEVMRERILEINPEAEVTCIPIKYLPERSQEVWSGEYDAIIDAIDNITAKCHLLVEARKRNIPVVTSTGAAGRMDPSQVRIADLSHTKVDPVALQVRKKLRRDYYYPANKSFHIPAVYSEEIPRPPIEDGLVSSPAPEQALAQSAIAGNGTEQQLTQGINAGNGADQQLTQGINAGNGTEQQLTQCTNAGNGTEQQLTQCTNAGNGAEQQLTRGINAGNGTEQQLYRGAFVDSDPDEDRPRRHAPPYGTSSFVVGTFGLFVAGKIVELLLENRKEK